MNTQHHHERQVEVIIDRYQREAILARQVRTVRGDQPGRILALAMRAHASISGLLAAAHARFHREPPAYQAPAACVEPVAEVSESAIVAGSGQ